MGTGCGCLKTQFSSSHQCSLEYLFPANFFFMINSDLECNISFNFYVQVPVHRNSCCPNLHLCTKYNHLLLCYCVRVGNGLKDSVMYFFFKKNSFVFENLPLLNYYYVKKPFVFGAVANITNAIKKTSSTEVRDL